MGFLGKVLMGIVIISAVVVFFRSYYPGSHIAATVLLSPITTKATTTLPVDASFSSGGYIDVQGTAIMDTTSGYPAVPFIKYVTSDHTVVTKQLIFADMRGCSPNAGDLPCVPTYATNNAYPSLTTGERIEVKGSIRSDRLIVDSITML
ncbi:hypothetical protein BH11PAT2_BH11PAT2_05150 [soil metagenome]